MDYANIEHKLLSIKVIHRQERRLTNICELVRTAVTVENGIETQLAPYNRQFASKTLPQRTMAIFAGPMMNFVLAFFLFIIIALLQGFAVSTEPKMGEISPVCGGAANPHGCD